MVCYRLRIKMRARRIEKLTSMVRYFCLIVIETLLITMEEKH